MRQITFVSVMVLAGVLAMAVWCETKTAADGGGGPVVPEVHVPPPPMGWSSWNSFSNTVDSKVVMAQAQALAASGLQKHGYEYVNIDEGWWLGARDAQGNILVEATQWPDLTPDERPGDMANIVKYIHGLGLKAGIYTDAGEAGCSFYGPDLGPPKAHTGSEGHYEQDFLQFAKWGFDYVKVDWCGGDGENLDPAVQYAQVARAICRAEAITGHRLYYSICNWGKNSPWTWAPGIGGVRADIWRTSGDIVAPIVANSPNSNRKASFAGMLGNFDKGIHPAAQHTGFYNDPDMMVLGMPGLTESENRVHMTLWAIAGAPLIIGSDLTTLMPATLATLTNPEVLAVDQDPLGLQCAKVPEGASGLEVWAKRLAQVKPDEARRAVVLLNRTDSGASITVGWNELGLEPGPAAARDLWDHKELGPQTNAYTATVAAHDAVMLLITGRDKQATRYLPVTADEFPEASHACACDAAPNASERTGEKTWTFRNVKSPGGISWIQVSYANPSELPALGKIASNGQSETMVSFPSTGHLPLGSVTVGITLKAARQGNMVTLSAPAGCPIKIDSISVLP